ncbi:MAG: DUF3307 domain-containing protein [Saprospiraceae bacterium]|nr:DUF3307 domain-containing protein [Saprospiraceae bacterium]
MILLVTKVILAHFIGDFYLQPSSWVHDKEQKKHKSIYLYLHSAIHGLLVWILLWEWSAENGLLLAVVHFVIQTCKTKSVSEGVAQREIGFRPTTTYFLYLYTDWTYLKWRDTLTFAKY